jgi:hypothetical protein
MPVLGAERLDVGAGGLRDAEPVQSEQRDQGMLGRGAEPGRDEQGADFAAVQADRVRLVVDPRAAEVDGWGVVEQVLLDGVLVQPGDRGQLPGDGGPRRARCFEFAGEQLDAGPADSEQPELPVVAPGSELAQVRRVGSRRSGETIRPTARTPGPGCAGALRSASAGYPKAIDTSSRLPLYQSLPG